MLYIVDFVILFFLITGIVIGWKRGFITSLISFLFTICIVIGAFYLKNFVSVFMYENLPFIEFGGLFRNISSLNILIYEAIAFILCILVLVLIVVVITKITDFVNKIVNATVILALPNKILGAVLSLLQFYIISYFILFVCVQFPYTNYVFGLKDSKVATTMVDKTPGLSLITSKYYYTYKEVYDIVDKNANSEDKPNADYETLEVLMKNEIITPQSVRKLIDSGKLKVENAEELIHKYNK